MSIDSHQLRTVRIHSGDPRAADPRDSVRGPATETWARENFSTALFTGLNIGVFLILAASVVGAAILYSQGA
jgi:hypothetical protein